MMKFVAIMVLFLSSSVFAAPDRSINDLQYLPNQGTIFGETKVRYQKFSDTYFDVLGEKIKQRNKIFGYYQAIGYGVLNNFSLRFETYYRDGEFENGDNKTKSRGMSDLNFTGRYRLLDGEQRLDVIADIFISPGDGKSKRNGNSNAYSGGNTLGVGMEYGVKKASHQWSLNALYFYNGEKKTKQKEEDGTSTLKYKAHSSFRFTGNLLTKLGEHSYIRNKVSAEFVHEYDTNFEYKFPGSSFYVLGSEYQHLLSRDLYLKAGLDAVMHGNGQSSVIMIYHVGANYQF